MKPQRILLISKSFWPLSGETELLAAEFARQLAVMVERVEVVTWKMVRQWPDRFTLGDISVHRLPQSQKSSWSAANLGQYGRSRWHRSLQRWLTIQAQRFDAAIVFEHESEALAPTLAACRAGLPVVTRVLQNQTADLSRVASRDWKSLMQSPVVFVSPHPSLVLDPLCRPEGPLRALKRVDDGVCKVGKINDPVTARKVLSLVHPIFQLKRGALLAVSGCDLTYDSGVFGLVRAWRRVVAKHRSARLGLIGTGRNAGPAEAQEVHQALREDIAARYDARSASRMRILYGGSMKPANAAELMACADVDGGLIEHSICNFDKSSDICTFYIIS